MTNENEFEINPFDPYVTFPLVSMTILSNPNNASSKSICVSTTRILTCHSKNLVLWSKNRTSYFIVDMVEKIKPHSDTSLLWKKMRIYNNKNKNMHRFTWKTLDEKNHEQMRRIIHYVKNRYKRREYQAANI